MKKRILSLFLAVLMFVSVLAAFPPLLVGAASDFSITSPSDDFTFDCDKMLTIKWTSYSGADHYWLTVKNMDGSTEHNGAVSSTSYSMYVKDPGTEYKIYAAAMDANDNVLDSGSAWDVIYVYTKDEDTFDISDDYFEFDEDGGTDTFWVYSSSSWSISDNQSWISVSPTSGSGDKKITVTCKENATSQDREGTITVTNKSTNEKVTIDVYQDAAEFKTEFDFSEFEISETVVLGEDLTWEGYVYIENDVFDNVTISLKKVSDGNYIYYRQTGVGGTKFNAEKILNGSITTGQKAPSGYQQDSNGNWYAYNNFAIDEVGDYLLYITASGKSTGEYDKKEYKFTVTKPDYHEPEVSVTVRPTQITLGESFTYSGDVDGNDYKINTVSIGIAYFRSESDYRLYMSDNEKYASLCADGVYIRYTDLNVTSKPVEGTIKTGAGCTVEGYALNSNNQYVPYEMSMENAGVYLISLNAWSEAYGTPVKDREAVVVIKNASATVGDLNGDGQITNKDRFLLNRYLANMTGYTDIDKTVADINGDGAINQADADYLTYHLAKVKGYENLPRPNEELPAPDDSGSNTCSHEKRKTLYAGETVFVNNNIKTDGKHSYYHMWCIVCEICDEILDEYQGNDGAVKGEIEADIACSYKGSDGVCSCGAINTAGYTSWTAKNMAGKQVSVYSTPYSSDGSYGKIFKDEEVIVLGSRAGRYLIDYAVPGGRKQGYVNTSFIASNSNYWLQFDFETVTLPISGKTVMLIPLHGYDSFQLYNGKDLVWKENYLENLVIVFSNESSCYTDLTTITGREGGYGTMSASYTYVEDGVEKTVNLQTPEYYIVADSLAIYTSDDDSVFSVEEKEYIMMVMDVALSGGDIQRPDEANFTKWDTVLLNTAELWKVIESLAKGNNPNTERTATVLAEYLEAYLAGTTGDYSDGGFAKCISSIFDFIWNYGSKVPYKDLSKNVQSAIDTISAFKGKKFSVDSFKEVIKAVGILFGSELDAEKFLDSMFDYMPDCATDFRKNGMSIEGISKTIKSMSACDKFFAAMDIIGKASDVIEIGTAVVEAGAILFGDYEKQRELLIEVKTVLVAKGYASNSAEMEAINLLMEQYDDKWLNKIKESAKELSGFIVSKAVQAGIAAFCPAANTLIIVCQALSKGTGVVEEAEYVAFRVISHAYICSMDIAERLMNDGIRSCDLEQAKVKIKMYINMAIYENKLASEATGEFGKEQIQRFKDNIDHMKEVFAMYIE